MSGRVPRKPRRNTLASRPSIAVEIANTQAAMQIDAEAIAGLVERTLLGEGIGHAQISVALVDDSTIRRINAQHLEHDWPTDVISFLLSEPVAPELIGELVISAEMAAKTAEEIHADPFDELALYLVHGLLHLCGHDDRTEEDALRMRQREDEVLSREGLTNTFARTERVASRTEGPEREKTPCSA